MGIRQMLERRRIRKELQRLVNPEVVAQLQTQFQVGHLETKHFQFVLILVDETNTKETPAVISRVVDTILEHGAILSNITSSLLVGLFGVPFPEGNSPEVRRGLVDALLRENGDRIRIVHGECDGAVGNLGNQKRWSYGAVIPRFSGVLKTLLETKFGTAVEVP